MAVSLRIDGLADIDIRGGEERITAEFLQDVVGTHAGACAPTADLGSSFLGVATRWHERHDGDHHAG